MDFIKNKNLLFAKIKQQVSIWLESLEMKPVSYEEVSRFLSSLVRSAQMLHLEEVYQVADSMLDEINNKREELWQKDELKSFLSSLIKLTEEYESYTEETQSEFPRNEKIPVIQIIDDDVTMLIFLKDALEEKGWIVIANTSLDNVISQYFDVNPDCVIIDVHLSQISGFKILEDLQNHTRKMFVPKIMISMVDDKETRLHAFHNGADDFISKPIDIEELIVRIERHLERKKLYDESVLLDELTGLYNRKLLADIFERNMSELKRNGHPFSLAILDIDHFKKINDQFGHLVGDHVLSSFAHFLKESTRHSDIIFRYGGEEFIILFPHTNLSQACEIAARILETFSKKKFDVNQETFSISFSAGVHSILTQQETLETVLEIADQALYKAKESGRARVESLNQILKGTPNRKLYVSVIDDDVIIRKMLTRILQSMEIDHYEADVQTYEDGLAFFKSNRLLERGQHFIILDGVMPVMDGLEILQKLKQNKHDYNNLLVLMLTSRKNEEDIARALKYGADDYITKPFSITELQARIKRLIYRMK
jgi:diguanylate cyclase (GGDEF)-like protein